MGREIDALVELQRAIDGVGALSSRLAICQHRCFSSHRRIYPLFFPLPSLISFYLSVISFFHFALPFTDANLKKAETEYRNQ